GGATTSREHTAVKIAPAYAQPTVHVLDASRAVEVVSTLLDTERRVAFDARNRDEQQRVRDVHAQKTTRPLLPLEAAQAKRPRFAWQPSDVARPAFLGRRVLDRIPLATLVPYIDWRFFFTAWELPGRFPEVLDDPVYGESARDLFGTAQRLLDRIVSEGLLQARGVYGFWPACAERDDIVLFEGERRETVAARFPMLRQQAAHANDQ